MDNKIKNAKNKVMSSKKFKYGSSAVVFSVVFVAFIVLFNVVLSLVDGKVGGLYVDLTTKQLYTVSEESVKLLKDTDKNVQIIFCRDRDKVGETTSLNYVKVLAEDYSNKFDNVSVVYKDKVSNPGYFGKFSKNGERIDGNSIIVYCESTGLSKVYSVQDMFVETMNDYGETYPFAFNGENKLTSAILTVARKDNDMLKAGVVTGHGESPSMNLNHFLTSYGFEVVHGVDLKQVTRQELSAFDLLVVCNPTDDFMTAQDNGEAYVKSKNAQTDEIAKISDYVFDDFGNVIFFFDYKESTSSRENLYDMMETRFGIIVNDEYRISQPDGETASGEYLIGEYYGGDTSSFGYSIHKDISQQNKAKPIFSADSTCAISISPKNIQGVEVSAIVSTTANAEAQLDGTNNQPGRFPLMTVSHYSKIVDYSTKTANVFVCASSGFIDGLTDSSYGNNDLFKSIVATADESILTNIDFEVLDEYNINVTKEVLSDLKTRLIIIVPLVIALAGIIVYVKRKSL